MFLSHVTAMQSSSPRWYTKMILVLWYLCFVIWEQWPTLFQHLCHFSTSRWPCLTYMLPPLLNLRLREMGHSHWPGNCQVTMSYGYFISMGTLPMFREPPYKKSSLLKTLPWNALFQPSFHPWNSYEYYFQPIRCIHGRFSENGARDGSRCPLECIHTNGTCLVSVFRLHFCSFILIYE